MALGVNHIPLNAEAQVRFRVSPNEIPVDKMALRQGFLRLLPFSPVSIIPLSLHTHSFIYHTRCIMFLSQYFSFPLSVSFHQCSKLIHSSTTHAV